MLYPVCAHQDGDGALGATIPDFPGCFSGAEDWSSLRHNVREAVQLYRAGGGRNVPKPSCLEDLRDRPEYAGGMWVRRSYAGQSKAGRGGGMSTLDGIGPSEARVG